MRVRAAIDGMDRIGRCALRGAFDRPDRGFEIVAVNDPAPAATVAHLLRHDSTHGRWRRDVESVGEDLAVDDRQVRVLHEPSPSRLPWRALGVEVVVDGTGRVCDVAGHLDAGARKIVLSGPGEDADATVVLGVNDDDYDPMRHDVVANASCTTNCAVPLALVLHRAFDVVEGVLTTVHGQTTGQNPLDGPCPDLRRARSAAVNIIPRGTQVAQALGEVLPELAGRIDGVALGVPVAGASLVQLTARLREPATVGQVNRAFHYAADGWLKDVLRCTTEPIVSSDVLGESASCLVDLGLTRVVGHMATVFGWQDDAWAAAQRTLDLLDHVARTLPLP
jgi:glyceraldehyde 3-phosphate dehydrogenase